MGIILLFITALRYLGMARKKENPNEKLINRAYGIVFIGLTILFSLYVLYFLSLEGYHVKNVYMGALEKLSFISEWLYRSALSLLIVFQTIFIYAFEKIRNKKYTFSLIIGIIGIILMILLPLEMLFTLGLVPITIIYFYFIHVLFTLMKWAKKELKAATSFIILGTILIANSTIFTNPIIMMTGAMPSILLPLSLLTGTILCVAPTSLKSKFFLQSTSFWYVFCAGVIGYSVFLFIFTIIFIPELAIFAFILLIFFSVEFMFFLKSLLKEEGVSTKKSVGVIGVFTRPETITEEEVSVSKEKKICLVCKGKLGGFNTYIFMCSDCNAFYCEKCSKALSNLENSCWACNAPIDPSKPSKPFEQEEKEEVVVEEKVPKKVGGDAK